VVSYPDPETGLFNPYPTFSFTGPLRPVYPLSPRREVPAHIRKPDYWQTGVPKSEQTYVGRHKITVLSKEEQDAMRKVCLLTREVLDVTAKEVRPGVTTDYLDEVAHKAAIERNVRKPKDLRKNNGV
jgi:methionyl aminopeptidase